VNLACPDLKPEKRAQVVTLAERIAQHVVAMDPAAEDPANAIATLSKQPFVLNPKVTVNKLLKETSRAVGSKLSVLSLERWARSGL
jgi:translation elongation factor EF-Ts